MRTATFVALCCVSLLLGCGGASGRSNVVAGPMPANGTFTGVWFSPQYGEMNIRQSGGAAIGEYSKDERIGKFQGTVHGNVLRFQWEETRELVRGYPTKARGRGYFKFTVGEDGKDNILGEWGIDDNETGGGPWNAYKLRNRKPELSTDSTSNTAATPEESGWGDQPQSTDDGLDNSANP